MFTIKIFTALSNEKFTSSVFQSMYSLIRVWTGAVHKVFLYILSRRHFPNKNIYINLFALVIVVVEVVVVVLVVVVVVVVVVEVVVVV